MGVAKSYTGKDYDAAKDRTSELLSGIKHLRWELHMVSKLAEKVEDRGGFEFGSSAEHAKKIRDRSLATDWAEDIQNNSEKGDE